MHKCATMMNIGAPYFVKSTDVCHVTERRERPKQKIKRKPAPLWMSSLRGELRNTTGTWRSSTAVSCFPLTFPAVSALLGCEGRRVGCGGGVFGCWWSGIWPGNQRELPPYKGFPVVKLIVRDCNCRADLFHYHTCVTAELHKSWLQPTRDEKVDFINSQNDSSVRLRPRRGSLIWFPLWV